MLLLRLDEFYRRLWRSLERLPFSDCRCQKPKSPNLVTINRHCTTHFWLWSSSFYHQKLDQLTLRISIPSLFFAIDFNIILKLKGDVIVYLYLNNYQNLYWFYSSSFLAFILFNRNYFFVIVSWLNRESPFISLPQGLLFYDAIKWVILGVK